MSKRLHADSFFAMGTQCDVVFTDIEEKEAERILQLVKTEIEQLEFLTSLSITESPLAKLNRAKKKNWIEVKNDKLWEILSICYDFWQMSDGAFDITVAPISALWKSKTADKILIDDIEKAKKRSGFDKVEFDFEQQRIRFLVDGMEFDLGAIKKGVVLDTLKPILEEQGVKSGIVSFGESSILAIGNHPNGEKWPLGIRNPFDRDEYIHVFWAQNSNVTTTGTIANTDDENALKRKHIISPVTGYPVDTDKMVSVLSNSATMGEFVTMAYLILPENDRNLIIDKLKNIEILEVEFNKEHEYQTRVSLV